MIYEHNDIGLIIKATSEDGSIFEWSYDENKNMISHRSPSTSWEKKYDTSNREILYVCGELVIETTYDNEGNATQTGWPE
jgi:YD repeat-containing protein